MPADRSPSTALRPVSTTTAPVSERTALAVIGSMILLMLALTILLFQATWVDPASATEAPSHSADGGALSSR
ncbi:MAG: hypothetical protein H0T86_04620 [Gemmatimonadales bacterium]|nr:hypothetical protein [Gemmatimonadales bacterium]